MMHRMLVSTRFVSDWRAAEVLVVSDSIVCTTQGYRHFMDMVVRHRDSVCICFRCVFFCLLHKGGNS